jgi:NADH-quinone oxidoreductase subunit N
MNPGALNAIVPMACVAAAGIAAMMAEAFREPGERMPIAGLGVVGLIGAAITIVKLWNHNLSSFGLVSADNFGLFVTMILVIVGLLTMAISGPTVERERLPAGEYYALILFALAGMMLMATATDLLVIFLALEVLSLAVYVLTGLRRDSPIASEAAFKYFLLGAFSSAFFLYGIAFTYGVTGSTHLDRIGSVIAAGAAGAAQGTMMQRLAVGLLLVGFAFKVSAVPFHMWTPDAYEGAPSSVTGFMSTGVKAAAFAAFVRVFLSAFEPMRADWGAILWVVAAATMILGTVVGVVQPNIKRMLAYSSIAHGGYLLVALLSANDLGKGAVLFYLLTYAVTNLGAFGVIGLLESGDRPPSGLRSSAMAASYGQARQSAGGATAAALSPQPSAPATSHQQPQNDQVRDYAGLWHTNPVLAGLMTVFLLSLGGFPPMAGFIAKWYVFTSAMKAGYGGLAIIGVLTSVVSVFFYLRVVVMMYMTEGGQPASSFPAVPKVAGLALVVSAIVIFYLGILPARVLDWAAQSISTIF